MSYDYSDKRHLGYEDSRGTIPTPFRRRLEEEAKQIPSPWKKRKKPPKPRKVDEATRHCGEPPAGYEKPTTWKRVAESPERTVLLATHEGWESIAHDLSIERREVKYASGETKVKMVVEGPIGKIHWRGNTLEGVKLDSLRVPGRGDKGREGAA